MATNAAFILESHKSNSPLNLQTRINKLFRQNLNSDLETITQQYQRRPMSLIGKRIFDIMFTLPVTVMLLPVFLIIGVLIKLDSAGPAIFTQKRVGKDGKLFTIYKFRTMITGAENLGKFYVCENDAYITRIGRVLRKYKLDELPQFFNVLKGDMSLVGPRPMIPQIVAQYPTVARNVVLSVPPGITGFGSLVYMDESLLLEAAHDPKQMYTREIIPMKLHYYINYVQIHNIWLDIQIILLTVVFLIRFIYHSVRGNKVFGRLYPQLEQGVISHGSEYNIQTGIWLYNLICSFFHFSI